MPSSTAQSSSDDDDDSDYEPPPIIAPGSKTLAETAELSHVARKKRKLLQSSQHIDKSESFMKRWIEQGDRSAMLELLRHRDGEAAMYEWNQTNMELCDPKSAADLVGDYDIVFCHGEPDGTDQGWTDGPISRTIRHGTLDIQDEGDEQQEEVVGTIVDVRGLCVREGQNANWEYYLQMNDLEFRQVENGHFQGDNSPSFQMTKLWGTSSLQEEFEVTIRILTNSGTLQWTPNESMMEDLTREDTEYIQFMQEQIEKIKNNNHPSWKEETSWLCRYMGLPAAAACHIHSYNRHELPSELSWSWQKGDLLLEMEMTEYATSWTTFYIARPRGDSVRENLLKGLDELVSHSG
jgi:hypothetical protein